MSFKRRRNESHDRLLRLLPECKVHKQKIGTRSVVVTYKPSTQRKTSVLQSPPINETRYHCAVDLNSLSKTVRAYYTATGSSEIPDNIAAKEVLRGKCSDCGETLDKESSIQCQGRCGKFYHPACGGVVETRKTRSTWLCFKCAGVSRP